MCNQQLLINKMRRMIQSEQLTPNNASYIWEQILVQPPANRPQAAAVAMMWLTGQSPQATARAARKEALKQAIAANEKDHTRSTAPAA